MSKKYHLNQSPLYKLSNRRKLAALLGFTVQDLTAIVKKIESYYIEYQYSKKPIVNHILFRKDPRSIQQVKPELDRIHGIILSYFMRLDVPHYLHSAIRGRSYETNASSHKESKVLYKVDLKKFYQNVKWKIFWNFFNNMMLCSPDVSYALSRICSWKGALPTGSCLSPLLSFWINKAMFDELYTYAESNNLQMTVYVDDIVFSGNNISQSMMYGIDCIIKKHGFITHKKRLYRLSQVKVVTGLAIEEGKVLLPHKRKAKMRILVKALKAESSERKRGKIENSLWGMLSEAKRFDSESAMFAAATVLDLPLKKRKRFESFVRNISF